MEKSEQYKLVLETILSMVNNMGGPDDLDTTKVIRLINEVLEQ